MKLENLASFFDLMGRVEDLLLLHAREIRIACPYAGDANQMSQRVLSLLLQQIPPTETLARSVLCSLFAVGGEALVTRIWSHPGSLLRL